MVFDSHVFVSCFAEIISFVQSNGFMIFDSLSDIEMETKQTIIFHGSEFHVEIYREFLSWGYKRKKNLNEYTPKNAFYSRDRVLTFYLFFELFPDYTLEDISLKFDILWKTNHDFFSKKKPFLSRLCKYLV